MNICTIICQNYRAQARVLAESFAAAYPDGTCVVLILDEYKQNATSADSELFESLTLADLGQPFFVEMAGYYDVLEFSTSVKPWLLEWMLDRYGNSGPIAYFDPDILITSTMPELEMALHDGTIALIPHLTDALPEDGMSPTEQHILLAGIYNLGFIGLRDHPETRRFLDFWKQRVRWNCINDQPSGFFVDQRYVDFVPGLFDGVQILRHRGYNVAYWNMSTRPFTLDEAGLLVSDVPVRFIHFSGYNPNRRDVISAHQDRILMGNDSNLAPIFHNYADALIEHGYLEFRNIPYGFDTTYSGAALTPMLRSVYKDYLAHHNGSGSVFTHQGEITFRAYLEHPDQGDADLSQAEALVAEDRPDLVGDANSVLVIRERLRAAGAVRTALGGFLVDPPVADSPVRQSAVSIDKPWNLSDGVNVVGYLNATVGVGEVARRLIGAMDDLSIPVWPVPLTLEVTGRRVPFLSPSGSGDLPFGHTLVCVNADAIASVADNLSSRRFHDKYISAVWWWEVDTFPDYFIDAFRYVDQVLVGSVFIRDALRLISPIPVHHLPIPIWVGETRRVERSVFGKRVGNDDFVYYFSFDYFSVFERKNPLAVIDAYTRAFEEKDGAHLVIKSINHEHFREQRGLLARAIGTRSDITVIEQAVSVEDRDRMVARCDCYVSLHRSEGLGMTIAEAMYLGKPVIATGYSGNLDFMNAENSCLVDYKLIPVGGGCAPYPTSAVWADPDVEQASEFMRFVFDHRAESSALGARGAQSIRRTNSISVTADALREIFA